MGSNNLQIGLKMGKSQVAYTVVRIVNQNPAVTLLRVESGWPESHESAFHYVDRAGRDRLP